MTAVVDASALAESLTDRPKGLAALAAMRRHAAGLHIPHLAVVETASVIRGWRISRQIQPREAERALAELEEFPARRWPADNLLGRIWELSPNLTAYDATYVALAESLDAILITGDERLRRSARRLSAVAFEVI